MNPSQAIFQDIYANDRWGKSPDPNERPWFSGAGSLVEGNDVWIQFMREFLRMNLDITRVADLGCGDFRCGEQIYPEAGVDYFGYDVVPEMIQFLSDRHAGDDRLHFETFDLMDVQLMRPVDLAILKDVAQHWPNEMLATFFSRVAMSGNIPRLLFVNDACSDSTDFNIKLGEHRPLYHRHPAIAKYQGTVLQTFYSGANHDLKTVSLFQFL